MGASMMHHCAPACDLTPNRIERIEQTVRAIPDDDENLRDLMDLHGYVDPQFAKQRIEKYAIESQQEDREITNLQIPGCPYSVRVAGGLSWGDPPSEAFTILGHVEGCPQLWQVLEDFAREDAAAAALDKGGAPASGAELRDVTVVLTSDDVGNEHFHFPSIPEALAAIRRLVVAAEQKSDRIERLIGIVVNPSELYGDLKQVAGETGR